jgi:uncharacterized protein (TIGR02391 family)
LPSWSELEKQFKELEPAFQHCRLDIQWGDSGEYFRIAGIVDRLLVERFEIIARFAGNKLDSNGFSQEYSEVFNEDDPLKRWYKALWKISNKLEFGNIGYMLNDKKETIGTIYTGTIHKIIDSSALMCLQLSAISDTCIDNNRVRSPYTVDNLHERVLNVSKDLYLDGHYRSAVLDAYIDIVDRVKRLSGVTDLDGSKLMQKVFSKENPLIILSDDKDEQLGFMWLFSGAVMAIRNAKAHKIVEVTDPQRTIEWLSFASVLHRVLDDIDSSI